MIVEIYPVILTENSDVLLNNDRLIHFQFPPDKFGDIDDIVGDWILEKFGFSLPWFKISLIKASCRDTVEAVSILSLIYGCFIERRVRNSAGTWHNVYYVLQSPNISETDKTVIQQVGENLWK